MGPVLEQNSFYRNVYTWFLSFLPDSLAWLAYFVAGFTIIFTLVNSIMVVATLYTYLERRWIGRFQMRIGPNRTGPFGLLQPIADAIKLLTKEDVVPRTADRVLFNLAPIVFFAPVLLVFAVVPFGKNTFLADLNIGVLYIVAVSGIGTIAILMAGWGSGNKYAMFGAMRGVAQLISYEIPLVLALAGVLLMAGSLSLVKVVEAQRIPFILLQPLGFVIFMLASLAELNRTPFDLVEGESEIIAGYHIEYSGMKFGLFQLGEFAAAVVTSGIAATLFLKGWEGPFLPSEFWFLVKVLFFLFLLNWVRATLPRLRVDQVMGFAWKYLFPLSLVNLFVVAVEVMVWPQPTMAQLWTLVAINWGMALLAVVLTTLLGGRKTFSPRAPVMVRRLEGMEV